MTREATVMRSLGATRKSSPCLLQLEEAHAKQQRPSAVKNKYINVKEQVALIINGMRVRKFRKLILSVCPTLCNPMDCSPPGSSVHRILQARKLEWAAVLLLQGIIPRLLSLLYWQVGSLPLVPPGVVFQRPHDM